MSTELINRIRRKTIATINRSKKLKKDEELRLKNDLVQIGVLIDILPELLEKHADTSGDRGYRVIDDITTFHPQAVQEVEMFLQEKFFTTLRVDEFDNGTEPNRTELWAKW